MGEGVLVADVGAGDPPLVHVGLVAAGITDVDVTPAADGTFISVVIITKTVHVMQVPGHGGVLAVDLKAVECLVATCVAGGFKDGYGAVLKAC